jgi:hypothetical protein
VNFPELLLIRYYSEPAVSLVDQPVFANVWHFGFALCHFAWTFYSDTNLGQLCNGERKIPVLENIWMIGLGNIRHSNF